jgi:hypothetical protein
MDIGSPLPPDLAEIDAMAQLNQHTPDQQTALIARLHAVHHGYNQEHEALYEKQRTVRDVLSKIYYNRDVAMRASFDLIVTQGAASSQKYTLEDAKDMLRLAGKGIGTLRSGIADRLKKIIESGKDEE